MWISQASIAGRMPQMPDALATVHGRRGHGCRTPSPAYPDMNAANLLIYLANFVGKVLKTSNLT